MKFYYFGLLALVFSSCKEPVKKVQAKKEIDSSILISCDGIGGIKITDTYKTIVDRFGENIFTEHENSLTGKYLTLWEDNPKQMNIYWNEKSAPFKTIKYLEINTPNSIYLTKDSIKVGQSMREVVKRNNFMPLTFNNISSANDAGLITSFNGGPIASNNPCLTGALEQVKINVVHKDEMKAFHKKEVVESSDPIFNRIDMELSTIRILSKQ